MYKEYPRFLANEVLEYDRKSRFDDPYLSVEEVLEKHARMINEYAERHLGGPIPAENRYKEVGSGESLDDRPEILKLLKQIEDPRIRAIIVVDVQRLSRGDLEDAGRLIRLLRYTKTFVITPYKIYDLNDDFDRDAFERELKRGNEYLEYFKKISLRGKLDSVREGNYIGSIPPYGFNRIVKENGKKICHTLEERKDQADVVRLVFEWYCNENIGTTSIARRLEALGVPNKAGGDKWHNYSIVSMLENVHYIGCVRWNWRKTIKIIKNQELKKLRPRAKIGEFLVFNGKHDPIISEELFNKAKEIKKQRETSATDTSLKNPLSGIMFCKTCGSRMGYNTFTRHGIEYAKPKVRCSNQVRCKSGSADHAEVMSRVCEALRDCVSDFEIRVEQEEDTSVNLYKNLIKDLEKKLKDLETKEKLQWEAKHHPNPEERMPADIFKELNGKLLKEKEEINDALCKAKDSVPNPIDYKDQIVKFTDTITKLEDPELDAATKNRHLRDIVERIEYYRPPNVKLTKANRHLYGYTESIGPGKGLTYHREPYEIHITIK
jgi:DNA invertase Pin-like site-specific DNA recombinase